MVSSSDGSIFGERGRSQFPQQPLGFGCRPESAALGSHIFLPHYYLNLKQGAARVHHESGHYIQSLMLGPLYLLVIGLPSLTWSALRLIKRIKEARSYYWFYTEAWAMRLADRYYASPIKS